MQKLKNALHNRRGETIVEVLVAFVLLMLFLALFTASLRFARRAAVQAQTTRDDAYMLTGEIYPANKSNDDDWHEGTENTMNFSRSDRTAFVVKGVQLRTYPAKVKDESDNVIASHTFTRYYKYKKVGEDKDDTKEDTTP